MQIKSLRVGETIRRVPTLDPWLVIRIFEYGWMVVNLLLPDDPAIPRIVLPRDYARWERDIDVEEKTINEDLPVSLGITYERSLSI